MKGKIRLYYTKSIYPSEEDVIEDLGTFDDEESLNLCKVEKIKAEKLEYRYCRLTIFEENFILTEDFGSWNRFFKIVFESKEDMHKYLKMEK